MDAKTLLSLIRPHLDSMDTLEKRSFNKLLKETGRGRRRKNLSLHRAKEKLRSFRNREMKKEQEFMNSNRNNISTS